jgi:sigma-E factor negative regulatory protein RseA
MSDQIREQVSAFLDGELPDSEMELLLKRLTRDVALRDRFGRYALIGESLRGVGQARLSQGFHARVNRAIDGEPLPAGVPHSRPRGARWWRPFAGAAVAAGVAAMAVVALQERAIAPGAAPIGARALVATQSAGAAQVLPASQIVGGWDTPSVRPGELSVTPTEPSARPTEAVSYTVPPSVTNAPTALPAARLTNYVFAHSKYSSVMGQNDVLNDLLSEADIEGASAGDASRDPRVAP